jgi:hypothetical protein
MPPSCRSDVLMQRRPTFLLVRWVNALTQQRPRTIGDLHLVFADGHTLCRLLERLRPGTHLCRFSRAVTRATAIGNIEQALNLVWSHLPQASAMPSAQQVLDGAPRELLLRFIDQLYSIFVVRPARAKLGVATRWLDELLAPYMLRLSDGASKPPHLGLGAELRSCTALAILLRTCLPSKRCADLDGEVYWQPITELERQRSVRTVLVIMERERLAPCSADEFVKASRAAGMAAAERCGLSCGGSEPSPSCHTAAEAWAAAAAGGAGAAAEAPVDGGGGGGVSGGPAGGSALEAELLLVMLSAAYQRYSHARVPAPLASEGTLLRFRDSHRHRAIPSENAYYVPPPHLPPGHEGIHEAVARVSLRAASGAPLAVDIGDYGCSGGGAAVSTPRGGPGGTKPSGTYLRSGGAGARVATPPRVHSVWDARGGAAQDAAAEAMAIREGLAPASPRRPSHILPTQAPAGEDDLAAVGSFPTEAAELLAEADDFLGNDWLGSVEQPLLRAAFDTARTAPTVCYSRPAYAAPTSLPPPAPPSLPPSLPPSPWTRPVDRDRSRRRSGDAWEEHTAATAHPSLLPPHRNAHDVRHRGGHDPGSAAGRKTAPTGSSAAVNSRDAATRTTGTGAGAGASAGVRGGATEAEDDGLPAPLPQLGLGPARQPKPSKAREVSVVVRRPPPPQQQPPQQPPRAPMSQDVSTSVHPHAKLPPSPPRSAHQSPQRATQPPSQQSHLIRTPQQSPQRSMHPSSQQSQQHRLPQQPYHASSVPAEPPSAQTSDPFASLRQGAFRHGIFDDSSASGAFASTPATHSRNGGLVGTTPAHRPATGSLLS